MDLAALLTELDAERVQRRAETVLADALYWFPVRHHSPGVARHLLAALRERKPEVLFIEAPSDASDLVPFIVDAKTKPPISIYSSYRDDDNVLGLAGIESPAPDVPAKFGVWYPLLPYSPEYVAIKESARLGASVVFIDLPHHAQILSHEERGSSDDVQAAPHSWEALAVESAFYKNLALAAGYRSWDACWDALFEAPERHASHESFRAELALFCAAVRATTTRERMEHDGTLLREVHMWQTITRTLAERKIEPSKAMVICGGFHLYMSRELGPERVFPRGTEYRTLTPYSYARTSDATGYGAGNRAPAFYARLFEHCTDEANDLDGAAVRAMVDHVVAVLSRGRREGELLSSADAISVTQHARMLASLRGRRSPSLDDIRDGLVSCCCKGSMEVEGRALAVAMGAVETGTAVGRVTPALGRLPLVHDFYRQVDELQLGETLAREGKAKLALDLRRSDDERKSIFFHRLSQIENPYVELLSAGRETTLFREVWRVAWTPKVDADLAEKNLHGDTIEAAALARLNEQLAAGGQSAREITEKLLQSMNMDLPGIVHRLEVAAGAAIDGDARLVSLGHALTHLVLLEGHARRKGLRTDVIGDLVERCYGRGCFTIPYAANVPPEEHDGIALGIKTLAEVLMGERGAAFDRALFVENVKSAIKECHSPYLRGVFCGVLTELRVQSPEELAAQVAAYARARPEVLVTCGEFLSGILQTSPTALLLGADAIVAAIDELLRAAEWEQFLVLLPKTRGAFEKLHARTRVSLADRVAVRYGLAAEAGETIARLETSLDVAERLVALDARVAEMMKEWEF